MNLPEWIMRARDVRLTAVAPHFGVATGKRVIAHCFACGATRETERNGKLPAHGGKGVGLTDNGRGGHCFACGERTDAIDYVAFAREGRRYRDCDRDGKARVRAWFVDFLGLDDAPRSSRAARKPRPTGSRHVATPQAEQAADRDYPPADDLKALWKACKRVDCVPAVASYLQSRGIDPGIVADRKLAAAIDDRALPSFATYGRLSWFHSDHLEITHAFDHHGVCRSVIARRVMDGDSPKSLPPAGHRRSGLVMACPTAQKMLRHGTHPSAWPDGVDSGHPLAMNEWWPADEPLSLVICEGEIDFLCWATEAGEDPFARAVISVVSGGWTSAHADRVPAGTRVTLATDRDPAGDKYAAQILATFAGRRDLVGRIHRWSAP